MNFIFLKKYTRPEPLGLLFCLSLWYNLTELGGYYPNEGSSDDLRVFLITIAAILLVILVLLYRLFPLKYYSYVLLYCDDLDPLLVMAVIRTESSFRENAVSPLGAYGLMQVMPQTAEWLNSKFNKNFDYKTVEGNIALGCLYLNYLVEKDGNLEDALIHYNTGPYAQQEIKDDAGRRYVRKVLRNYNFYKFLYRR